MNLKTALKSTCRELMPPLLWRFLGRQRIRGGDAQRHERTERSASFYDAVYKDSKEYGKHYADSIYYPIWCVLLDRLQPQLIQSVLDIGCGSGQLAAFLRDRGLRKYVGIDFSAECIRIARAACPSFEFVCEDAFASQLLAASEYEVVISTEFLEHVEDDLRILDRVRLGTRVYGSVPNFPHPGHVRHFKSAQEVHERYQSRFSDFRVDEFRHGSGGMSLFLFEGVRTDLAIQQVTAR